jgi:cell division control protein 7
MSNVPTVDQSPPNLTDLVLTLNPHLYTPPHANPTPEEARKHIEAMDHALDLCSKLLKLDATKRLTAKQALHHQFFHDPIVAFGEDSGLPILRGVDGKCGHLHSVEDGKRGSLLIRTEKGLTG